jgi:hypothetical protein
MALNNDLNTKAGLDTVTQEEHDDITFTFAALADPEAASDSASVLADAADFDSNNLINNVFYINLSPNTESLEDSWRQRLKTVTENVDMSTSFFNDKASRVLNDAVAGGQISPKDETKKANYFAKVINHLVTSAPWYAIFQLVTSNHNSTCPCVSGLMKGVTGSLPLPSTCRIRALLPRRKTSTKPSFRTLHRV